MDEMEGGWKELCALVLFVWFTMNLLSSEMHGNRMATEEDDPQQKLVISC